jgi:hypothetical protein
MNVADRISSIGRAFASRLANGLVVQLTRNSRLRPQPVALVQFLSPVVGFAVPGSTVNELTPR